MHINKDTKIYGSFSIIQKQWVYFFNKRFQEKNINAIYKSFFSNNLLESINAAKSLNFSGFALSMPFKIEILSYADNIDPIASKIGSEIQYYIFQINYLFIIQIGLE